jgi:uncharacterized Fe-S radical SAM superfamily protein PflX
MNQLPKGLQQIYVMADKCCKVLMMKGITAKSAEETVLNVLKEYESDLKAGNYKKVETALEMKFA